MMNDIEAYEKHADLLEKVNEMGYCQIDKYGRSQLVNVLSEAIPYVLGAEESPSNCKENIHSLFAPCGGFDSFSYFDSCEVVKEGFAYFRDDLNDSNNTIRKNAVELKKHISNVSISGSRPKKYKIFLGRGQSPMDTNKECNYIMYPLRARCGSGNYWIIDTIFNKDDNHFPEPSFSLKEETINTTLYHAIVEKLKEETRPEGYVEPKVQTPKPAEPKKSFWSRRKR